MAPKRTEPKTSKAPAARKPAIRRRRAATTVAVSSEQIATRAYFLHLDGGDDPLENWLRAEREIIGV
jgi:Protein of unknown function (DUF2934)